MDSSIMALMAAVLPFLKQQRQGGPNAGFVSPGANGTPNMAQMASALANNPATASLSPDMVSGVSQAQAVGGAGSYDTWDSIGRMAQLVRQATAGSDGGGTERSERFVHGAPQPMPAKIGNPQTDFQMQNMQNPISSVGQYLLSPAGQQIIKALQSMGA